MLQATAFFVYIMTWLKWIANQLTANGFCREEGGGVYQALYRKWRPMVFSDVIGQDHVTVTLKNEIMQNRLSHAYLFAGSRGTGKTTCAKILAKAVNCLQPVNGDPCNTCAICTGLNNGSILDVTEIDAASNNGVDNIRDLREEVNFTPAQTKMRAYIIDEVHMLSTGAFNALLKTLEEPPPHALFILATTEVHKLPATILSRCQRFDFRRIVPADIVTRLQYIAGQEGFILEEEAAYLIARVADGAMRDALSLLDQCAGHEGPIDITTVSAVAGLAHKDYLFRMADAILARDSATLLTLIDELHNASCDMERLCAEMIQFFRNLMLLKTVQDPAALIVCTPTELQALQQEAAQFSLETIFLTLDTLQHSADSLHFSPNRRVEMEMTLLKLCHPALNTSNDALLARIANLESKVQDIKANPLAPAQLPQHEITSLPSQLAATPDSDTVSQPKAERTQPADLPWEEDPLPPDPQPEPERKVQESPPPPPGPGGDTPFREWPQVLQELRNLDMPLCGILNQSFAVVQEDHTLLIQANHELFASFLEHPTHKKAIQEAVLRVTKQEYKLGIYQGNVKPNPDPAPNPLLDTVLQRAQEAGIPVDFSKKY